MAQPLAPNLNTFAYSVAVGMMIIFPKNKHRTRFVIQDRDTQNILFWVGNNPSTDLGEWLSLGGSMEPDTVDFTHGIAGPIYITDDAGGIGNFSVISPLEEAPTLEAVPV